MKKQILYVFFVLFSALCFFGCGTAEVLTKSDLTIFELEEKMEKAMDPEGSFNKAESYVQREMFKIKGIFFDSIFQVDLKYKKPYYLRLTTLENNQPVAAVIYNNGSAWSVNYSEKEVKEISGDELLRIDVLHRLTAPNGRYSQLFKKVDVYRCVIEDDPNDYYKIVCNPDDKENTISIYVDAKDFLPRRIDADLTVIVDNKKIPFSYDSYIESYESMDNVMIPQKVSSVSDGVESTTTVFDYKLNVKIPESEFHPPIFTENKLRDRMDRFRDNMKSRNLRNSIRDKR